MHAFTVIPAGTAASSGEWNKTTLQLEHNTSVTGGMKALEFTNTVDESKAL